MTATFAEISTNRDNNFNLIRFVAASSVLVSHAFPIALGAGAAQPLETTIGVTLGNVAVQIFFALSGFLIAKSYIQQPVWQRFIEARCRRLFPALAVALILTIVCAALVFRPLSLSDYSKESAIYFFRNLSLFKLQYGLADFFTDAPYPNALNGSLWTLRWEFTFYILVLAAGLVGALVRPVYSALALVIFFCANFVIETYAIQGDIAKFISLGLPYCTGVAIYQFRDFLKPSFLGIVICVPVIWFTRDSALGQSALSLWLAFAALSFGYKKWPPLLKFNRLGDYSYGMYIYAFPVQQFATHFGTSTALANFAVAFPTTLLLAIASWHLIEKPVLRARFFTSPATVSNRIK